MIARLFATLATVLSMTFAVVPAHAAPLEAYGRLPTLEEVALSPDGQYIAYVSVVQGKRAVIVTSLVEKKIVAALNVSETKLRDLAWADSEHLLITTSQTGYIAGVIANRGEHFMTLIYDVKSKNMRNILQFAGQALNVVAGPPEPRVMNGKTVIFVEGVSFVDNRGRRTLFAVDERGRVKVVESKSPNALDWVIDAQGNVVAETDYDEKTQRWSLLLKKDGKWVEAHAEDAPINTPDVEGVSPDGKSLIVSSSTDTTEWRALNIASGTWDSSVDLSYMVSTVVKDPATHLIIGGRRDTTKARYFFFDPKDEQAWESIGLTFDGENVELNSWTQDRSKVVVKVSGERFGAGYVLVDLKNRQTMVVGNAYEGIAAADVAPVRAVNYDAADGTKIPAYLTLPKGRDAKKLPLIVLVHGGPASRDRPGFDWWSQAIASRGYAVLQPQFRGSAGISDEHLNAGFGEWGRKMQSDVSDGVRELAKQGVVDPARVCIVGGSYGGYAALAGVTLEKGVYRCAVSVAGVADPRGMLKWVIDRQWRASSLTLRYWDRFMGVSGPKDPKLDEISPLVHVAKASAPILLIHGKADTVVDYDQSDTMAQALKKAGKPVRFVTLRNEDHWLSGSDTRLQMLEESVKFLETHNPPG